MAAFADAALGSAKDIWDALERWQPYNMLDASSDPEKAVLGCIAMAGGATYKTQFNIDTAAKDDPGQDALVKWVAAAKSEFTPTSTISTQSKAGIIGAGPSGLFTAYYLLKSGKFSTVTVYERRWIYNRAHIINMYATKNGPGVLFEKLRKNMPDERFSYRPGVSSGDGIIEVATLERFFAICARIGGASLNYGKEVSKVDVDGNTNAMFLMVAPITYVDPSSGRTSDSTLKRALADFTASEVVAKAWGPAFNSKAAKKHATPGTAGRSINAFDLIVGADGPKSVLIKEMNALNAGDDDEADAMLEFTHVKQVKDDNNYLEKSPLHRATMIFDGNFLKNGLSDTVNTIVAQDITDSNIGVASSFIKLMTHSKMPAGQQRTMIEILFRREASDVLNPIFGSWTNGAWLWTKGDALEVKTLNGSTENLYTGDVDGSTPVTETLDKNQALLEKLETYRMHFLMRVFQIAFSSKTNAINAFKALRQVKLWRGELRTTHYKFSEGTDSFGGYYFDATKTGLVLVGDAIRDANVDGGIGVNDAHYTASLLAGYLSVKNDDANALDIAAATRKYTDDIAKTEANTCKVLQSLAIANYGRTAFTPGTDKLTPVLSTATVRTPTSNYTTVSYTPGNSGWIDWRDSSHFNFPSFMALGGESISTAHDHHDAAHSDVHVHHRSGSESFRGGASSAKWRLQRRLTRAASRLQPAQQP